MTGKTSFEQVRAKLQAAHGTFLSRYERPGRSGFIELWNVGHKTLLIQNTDGGSVEVFAPISQSLQLEDVFAAIDKVTKGD
jgi:hypothetical protein